MIPQGVFNQDSRDLSKEIWISWGVGYDQEGGVYVNQISPVSTQQSLELKNAKGDNTTFYLFQGDFYQTGINSTTYSTGTLDIINRREINVMYYYQEEGFEVDNYLALSTTGGTVSGDIYILGSRINQSAFNSMIYTGWSKPTAAIPATVGYPVQTKMDVNNDWYKVEGVSTFQQFNLMPSAEGWTASIRAIVIKLL